MSDFSQYMAEMRAARRRELGAFLARWGLVIAEYLRRREAA
jgi:hypothetical protein